MKLIEGLKKIKELSKKADDLKDKVKNYCVHMSYETPTYPDQKGQIKEWIQAHSDILKEILNLRIGIQKTNLETQVTIELGGKGIIKSIAEWIHRRRDLALNECSMWRGLTDKGLREGQIKDSKGDIIEAKITRCYDPTEKDNRIDLYENEPSIIDSKLETVNAITDIVGFVVKD
jgi:hypothetical protein